MVFNEESAKKFMELKTLIAIALAGALFLMPTYATAAVVKGTVFDSNLQPTKAIVSINTAPSQTRVASNGEFNFEVPRGVFVLKASSGNASYAQNISVESEGVFNVDLILFGFEEPSLETPTAIPGKTGFETQQTTIDDKIQPSTTILLAAIGLLVLILLFVFYRWGKLEAAMRMLQKERLEKHQQAGVESPQEKTRDLVAVHSHHESKKPEAHLNDLQKNILEELKKSEGRMTQKDLRKILPFSEAKVSIELDELEEKGLVKKFKKGRGNVIVRVEK